MKSENGKIDGDLVVSENLRLNGMVTGNIKIIDDAELHLSGMCLGTLNLEGSSSVYVHGMVKGDINNPEGYLHVGGVVKGNVISGTGDTEISSGAVVSGEIISPSNSSNNAVIATTVGGAVIGNLIVPGLGGAIVGGVRRSSWS